MGAVNDNNQRPDNVSRIVFAGFEPDEPAYIENAHDLWFDKSVQKVMDMLGGPEIGFEEESYHPKQGEIVIMGDFYSDITTNILDQFERILESQKRA